MKIQNIRFGHACNSSSLHSIIVFDNGHVLPEFCTHDVGADGWYGCNDFILSSFGSKLGYIGALLQHAVEVRDLPPYLWDYYRSEWLRGFNGEAVRYCGDVSVDHNSLRIMPGYFGSDQINREFFAEMKTHLLDPNTVITGGDDQGELGTVLNLLCPGVPKHDVDMVNKKLKEHHAKLSPVMKIPCDYRHDRARKDQKYGFWSIFNKETGAKVRLSFDNQSITCASRPELVDIKITDMCHKQCPYCYQSSHPCGSHADFAAIEKIVRSLANLEVWEIAWNGGEPTEHPDFLQILRLAHEHEIVSNFTTRNLEWFRIPKNIDAVKRYCGRVAFSVGGLTERDFDFLDELSDEINVCIQAIDTIDNITDTILTSPLDLTLLGFKNQGRAKNLDTATRIPHTPLINILRNKYHVGIDTQYAQDYINEIRQAYVFSEWPDVPDMLVTPQDGLYSMYIDAITGYMGPFSYCMNDAMVPIPPTTFVYKSTGIPYYMKWQHVCEDELSNGIEKWFTGSSKLMGKKYE